LTWSTSWWQSTRTTTHGKSLLEQLPLAPRSRSPANIAAGPRTPRWLSGTAETWPFMVTVKVNGSTFRTFSYTSWYEPA
jgi:hypothetical protein